MSMSSGSRLRIPVPKDVVHALTPVIVDDERQARRRGITRRQLNLARAWNLDLLPSLDCLTTGLVVDVGAHEGLWTRDILELSPSSRVVAFEPQPDLCGQIRSRFAGDTRVTVDCRAVSSEAGQVTLHRLEASVNASLLEPRPGMNDVYKSGWGKRATETVEATTLDTAIGGEKVGLLKIDVQGAEAAVLAGARGTLGSTDAVMLEVTFRSHYQGDSTFCDLNRQMVDQGFVFCGLADPARSPTGAALCSDACYVAERIVG